MEIESRELDAFLAVAETLHFTRAAERLGLSTTRVSSLVKTLERRLDSRLFTRTSRRVRLTQQGAFLLRELRPATLQIKRAMEGVRSSGGGFACTLRVGFDTSVPGTVAAGLAAAANRVRRGCRVVPSSHPTADLFRWQREEQWPVDVFLTWMPQPPVAGLNVSPPVLRAPRAVAVSPAHPVAGLPTVCAHSLAEHDLAYPDLPAWYAEYWLPQAGDDAPAQKVRPVPTGYLEHILGRVAEDDTLAHLVPADAAATHPDPALVVVPVTGLAPIEVRAVWPDPAPSAHCRCFARLAAEHGAAAGWLDPAQDRHPVPGR